MTQAGEFKTTSLKLLPFKMTNRREKKLFLAHRRVYIGKVINLNVTIRQTV
jgi:hypothetical protein